MRECQEAKNRGIDGGDRSNGQLYESGEDFFLEVSRSCGENGEGENAGNLNRISPKGGRQREATKTETAMGRIREEVGWQRNGEQEQKMDGHGDSW